MNLFKSKPKKLWRVIRVHVLMDSKQMSAYAFLTASVLLDEQKVSKVYFASYSNPHAGTTYVEFKVLPRVSDEELKAHLGAYGPEIHAIDIQPFEGSDAHAQAFLLARTMRGSGGEQINDVVHWLLNMNGFSYLDEIKLHSHASHQLADNMQKMGSA